jgi:hypothetical protein
MHLRHALNKLEALVAGALLLGLSGCTDLDPLTWTARTVGITGESVVHQNQQRILVQPQTTTYRPANFERVTSIQSSGGSAAASRTYLFNEVGKDRPGLKWIREPNLANFAILTYNYADDFNKNKVIDLSDFVGLKDSFCLPKEQSKFYFSSDVGIPANTAVMRFLDGDGNIRMAETNTVAGIFFAEYMLYPDTSAGTYAIAIYRTSGEQIGKKEITIKRE